MKASVICVIVGLVICCSHLIAGELCWWLPTENCENERKTCNAIESMIDEYREKMPKCHMDHINEIMKKFDWNLYETALTYVKICFEGWNSEEPMKSMMECSKLGETLYKDFHKSATKFLHNMKEKRGDMEKCMKTQHTWSKEWNNKHQDKMLELMGSFKLKGPCSESLIAKGRDFIQRQGFCNN